MAPISPIEEGDEDAASPKTPRRFDNSVVAEAAVLLVESALDNLERQLATARLVLASLGEEERLDALAPRVQRLFQQEAAARSDECISRSSSRVKKRPSLIEVATSHDISYDEPDSVRARVRVLVQQAVLRFVGHELRWAWLRWQNHEKEEAVQLVRYLMIPSLSGFSLLWTALMALCILMILVMEPFAAAFLPEQNLTVKWLNRIFDVLFIYDIFVNFRTGFYDPQDTSFEDVFEDGTRKEVLEPGVCAARYLRSWFLLDFVSSMPPILQGILSSARNDNAQVASTFRGIKILKLGRVLKVTKMLKFSAFFSADESPLKDYVEEFVESSSSLFFGKMCSLFFTTLLLAHLLACCMVLSGPSWLSSYEDPKRRHGASEWVWQQQYVAAFYWAVTTVSTVGYGDIGPHGTHERLYAIGAIVIGVWFYSYIIASVSSMVTAKDATAAKYYEKMDQVGLWMSHHNFKFDVRRRVRKHFREYYAARTALDEREIMTLLNPRLADEISVMLLPKLVLEHPLFKNLPTGALAKLVLIANVEHFAPGATVVQYGAPTSSLWIIIAGYVDCEAWVLDDDGTARPHREIVTLRPGASFGEYEVLGLHATSLVSVAARTPCTLLRVQQDALLDAFSSLPEVLAAMKAKVERVSPRGFVPPPIIPVFSATSQKHTESSTSSLSSLLSHGVTSHKSESSFFQFRTKSESSIFGRN